MTVYDSPIYELEIGLDSVPDPYIDRYDMWIFDDAKSLFTKIPDMMHKPKDTFCGSLWPGPRNCTYSNLSQRHSFIPFPLPQNQKAGQTKGRDSDA